MKEILNHLFEHNTLTKSEAEEILLQITSGIYSPSQVGSFLTVFRMRSITVDELEGFRDAMLKQCIRIDLDEYDTVDLCGTGGDGKDTFNISTLASFVVAGAGVKVAKHGNYGVSSVCGSSNVLESLGIVFSNDHGMLRRNLETAGICFLHAPMFHPAMKYVAPIRRELGVKTFFNMLGPMVNPSMPRHQLVGVFSLELARLYSYLYQKSEKRYSIVHSLDGYDEVSLTGPFKVISKHEERLYETHDLGWDRLTAVAIAGGKDVESSAELFMRVLQGKGTDQQNRVVIINAAMAIQCVRDKAGLHECIDEATTSLMSGKALRSFQLLKANVGSGA